MLSPCSCPLDLLQRTTISSVEKYLLDLLMTFAIARYLQLVQVLYVVPIGEKHCGRESRDELLGV